MAVCCMPISSELLETDKHGNIKLDWTKASLDKISEKFSYELNYSQEEKLAVGDLYSKMLCYYT